MGPARFHCATLVYRSLMNVRYSADVLSPSLKLLAQAIMSAAAGNQTRINYLEGTTVARFCGGAMLAAQHFI